MTDLEKYEAVNGCETLPELAAVIESFGNYGSIEGRSRSFDSEKMALFCLNYSLALKNTLTRKFGIRQQAMYILMSEKLRNASR